jgi:MGT family glycosyltransferase
MKGPVASTHFGVICPEVGGHLNPMIALGKELQRRGHRLTFYQRPYGRAKVEAAGLTCRTFAEAEYPVEATAATVRRLGDLRGLTALRFTWDRLGRSLESAVRDLPAMIRDDGVSFIIADSAVSSIGATLAECAGIPYALLSSALVDHFEREIPPCWTSWKYNTRWWAIVRNRIAYKLLNLRAGGFRQRLAQQRRRLGLPAVSRTDAIVHISIQPPGFDYPRRAWPANLHFTGPITDPTTRPRANFPFEQLDARPLIYVAVGTIIGAKPAIFRCIAQACAEMNVQLVIALGGAMKRELLGELPCRPIVVDFAPQLEILKRAALCITHAGTNTVFECLAEGVPIVALPVMNDGPGTAARIEWLGCGEMLLEKELNPQRLRKKIKMVLGYPRYRQSAEKLREAIKQAGGVKKAADLIENAVISHK